MAAVGWLQVNIALNRERQSAWEAAYALFDEMMPQVELWRRDRHLERFFFMRKRPDVRLRFLVREHEPVAHAMTLLLRRLKRRGVVSRYSTSTYEPEHHLFGGRRASALVHRFFDEDTKAWWEMENLWRTSSALLGRDVLLAAVINDLAVKLLRERTEIWDVWMNLLGGEKEATSALLYEGGPFTLSEVHAHVSRAEKKVLLRYERATRHLVNGLDRLWERGALDCGPRALLAWIATFLFNRYGMVRADCIEIARSMASAWNPHRRMRGAPTQPRTSAQARLATMDPGMEGERLLRTGEPTGVVKKKVLLFMLARQEMQRLRLPMGPEQVDAVANDFRHRYRLGDVAQMEAWLREQALSPQDFFLRIRDFIALDTVLTEYTPAVETELESFRAMLSARGRA